MTRIYKVPFATLGDDVEVMAPNEQPDGKVSFPTGWTSVYELENDDPSYKPIGRGEMNGLFGEITEGIGELQLQGGVIRWRAIDGGFNKGAIVYGSDMQTMWQSTVDANTTDPESAEASGWLVMPSRQSIVDLIDEPLIGNLQFRAAAAEGNGWLRLPEKATSANANISRAQYGKLFAKIGTSYGAGDGSTTFGLPTILDSNGQFSCFLRPMLSSGTIGAKHGDTIRDIKGNVGTFRYGSTLGEEGGPFAKRDSQNTPRNPTEGDGWAGVLINFDVSRVVPTGPENTPKYVEYPVFIFAGRNPA